MKTHTAGPWRFRVSGSDGVYILPDTGDKREDLKYIAKVDGRDLLTDQKNAALIAAAPELLEALEEMLTNGGTTPGEWMPLEIYRKAEAAIAKAKPQK